MIIQSNSFYLIRVLWALTKLIISNRIIQDEETYFDEDFLNRDLLPNYTLVLMYLKLLVLLNNYMVNEPKGKKKNLIKPHILMRLLHGYRLN